LGANEDLKQANKLAKRMIGNFGMGEKLEVFFNEDVGDESNPFLGRSLAFNNKYSEYTKSVMDKESLHLVNEAYIEAKNLLQKNYKYLVEFSDELKKNIIVGKDNPIVLQILNETQI
jgi:cell division protease FtsH